MKRLKKLWQIAFLTVLLGMFFSCINIKTMSFAEYMAIVLFGLSICQELFELCPEKE